MPEQLFEELKKQPQVEAISLGGSRAGEMFDEKSDYDVYVYCRETIPESVRKDILSIYCSHMEIGNHFWEYEDNCTLNNGIDIDIIYRNLDDFAAGVAEVVEQFQSHNGYTTCMWHNLITGRIIYDKTGRLRQYQERFQVSYPVELKNNIIDRNMKLLKYSMPAYDVQICKAVKRKDLVSINHRVTEFLASYFDILFALNEMTHPGEKRLIELCKQKCKVLPKNFESNLNRLFQDMFTRNEMVPEDISNLIRELEYVLPESANK